MPESPSTPPKFWLMIGAAPDGPFTATEVRSKLDAGEVGWHALACPVGGRAWGPLSRTAGIGDPNPRPARVVSRPVAGDPRGAGNRVAINPDGGDVAIPSPVTVSPVLPAWNPAVIAALSVLFTPLWGGVLGAVNAGRLGLPGRRWRPLAVGLAAYPATRVPELVAKYPPYWVDAALYLGLVGLLWGWGLAGQGAGFRGRAAPAGWRWPVALGSPLAALAVAAMVVFPLLPPDPWEVCDRFVEAWSAREARRYTTPNLYPVVDLMFRAGADGPGVHFELTERDGAAADQGGWLIGYRVFFDGPGERPGRIGGVFHLVGRADGWRIEDIYVTESDGQPVERPISFARDYRELEAVAPMAGPSERRWPTAAELRGYTGLVKLTAWAGKGARGVWVGAAVAVGALCWGVERIVSGRKGGRRRGAG